MVYSFGSATTHNATLLDMIYVANNATSGVFVFGFLLSVFCVQAILLNNRGVGLLGSVTLSSWFCFLYSSFLVVMGNIFSLYVSVFFLIVAGIGSLVLAKQQ